MVARLNALAHDLQLASQTFPSPTATTRKRTFCASMLLRCSLYIISRLEPPSMPIHRIITRQTLHRASTTTVPTHARHAPFTSTAHALSKPLPPRRVIPDDEIIENFLKGSGPGGQKINKTSSAVQLKHIPTGIVVKCQDTRSRTQNRKTARKILQDRIEEAELGEDARTRIKAREAGKKKKSADKKKRRKYRALAEGKEGTDRDEGGGEGVYEGEPGEVGSGKENGNVVDRMNDGKSVV